MKHRYWKKQGKYRKKSRQENWQGLWPACRWPSRTICVPKGSWLHAVPRSWVTLYRLIHLRQWKNWKKPVLCWSVRPTWTNLPWEAPQRLPLTELQETLTIQIMSREDLPVVPAPQWPLKNVLLPWVPIPVVPSASQVLSVALPASSRLTELYLVTVWSPTVLLWIRSDRLPKMWQTVPQSWKPFHPMIKRTALPYRERIWTLLLHL